MCCVCDNQQITTKKKRERERDKSGSGQGVQRKDRVTRKLFLLLLITLNFICDITKLKEKRQKSLN